LTERLNKLDNQYNTGTFKNSIQTKQCGSWIPSSLCGQQLRGPCPHLSQPAYLPGLAHNRQKHPRDEVNQCRLCMAAEFVANKSGDNTCQVAQHCVVKQRRFSFTATTITAAPGGSFGFIITAKSSFGATSSSTTRSCKSTARMGRMRTETSLDV
jgi:hypothetical protein